MAQYTEVFRISPHLIIYLQIPDINIFNNQSPPLPPGGLSFAFE